MGEVGGGVMFEQIRARLEEQLAVLVDIEAAVSRAVGLGLHIEGSDGGLVMRVNYP